MKKFYLIIFSIFILDSLQAQTGGVIPDVEHDRVCWDSLDVLVPLISKKTWVPGTGRFRVDFHDPVTGGNVVPTVGTVYGDPCGSSLQDTLVVKLDSLKDIMVNININLDSIKNDVLNQDTCNCLYTVDLENSSYSIADNSQFITWTGERVVKRNCGQGEEEISRQPHVSQQTGKTYNLYNNNVPTGTLMVDGVGYIDSFNIHLTSPVATLPIDLNPSTVTTTYPNLLTFFPSFVTGDLVFQVGNELPMETAIKNVIDHALSQYAGTNTLPTPSYDLFVDVKSTGQVLVGFAITNNPIGHYANINFDAADADFFYNPDGTETNSIKTVKSFSNSFTNVQYQTSCGLIQTWYQDNIQESSVVEWTTVTLGSPAPSLLGLIGSITCKELCQTVDDGCLSICDTVIVSIAEAECIVQNKHAHEAVTLGSTKSYSINSFNSISVTVTNGNLTVYAPDFQGVTTGVVYPNGYTFSWTADDCKYNMSEIVINGAVGTGIIQLKY